MRYNHNVTETARVKNNGNRTLINLDGSQAVANKADGLYIEICFRFSSSLYFDKLCNLQLMSMFSFKFKIIQNNKKTY